MKKIKILLAVITVLTILSTAVFAADSALNFGADTVEYTEGENLVISVYSGVESTIDKAGYFCLYYDVDVWSFVDEGDARTTDYEDGYMEITVDYVNDIPVTKGQKLFDLKFEKTGDGEAVGTLFEMENDGGFYVAGEDLEIASKIEVVAAKAPEPEKPVSVPTTMTIGEKEYTDVPNAVVSGTIENGAFNGSIVVDYWKDGVKALDPKVFSTFAGMPTFSGSGTASFKVAIMGVPSNVIITNIAVQ